MIIATVVGNLGKDATLRTANGDDVCSFSVASNSGYGERQKTTWVNCSLWGERGLSIAKYLVKGTPVTITGELTLREYQGKTFVEVNVDRIKMQGRAIEESKAPAIAISEEPDDLLDDEIPF